MAVPITDALELLAGALRRLELPLWRAPASSRPLDELRATLAPLELPDDLVTFWKEVDVSTLCVGPYPPFTDAEWARTGWLTRRHEFSDIQPLALVDVGYESHAVLSVELTIGDQQGGAVFFWWVDDLTFYRCFDGLGDWIAVIASCITRGATDRHEVSSGRPWVAVETEQTWSADPADPGHFHLPVGVTEVVSYGDAAAWPSHWRSLHPSG